MSKAKSSTKRKVDEHIQEFIDVLREFTYQELYEILTKSKDPLIYAVNENEYALGRYIVVKENEAWTVYTYLGDVEHRFQDKVSALLYSLLLMKNHLNLARRLVNADTHVFADRNELTLYTVKLHNANREKNSFKEELYAAKLSNARHKYAASKEELEETLKTAKYLKLGT